MKRDIVWTSKIYYRKNVIDKEEMRCLYRETD